MIIADTSGLIAFFSESGRHHEAVVAWLEGNNRTMVVSPFVIAEVDYLVATRKGLEAELSVLRELAGGAYELPAMSAEDIEAAAEVVHRYRDLGIGIADASLVILAERYGTRTILTLDRRLGVVRPLGGGHFEIIPGR